MARSIEVGVHDPGEFSERQRLAIAVASDHVIEWLRGGREKTVIVRINSLDSRQAS